MSGDVTHWTSMFETKESEMKINILNNIPLDMPFFLEEELVWINKHFTIVDNILVKQSSYIEEEAANWLTHLLRAASRRRAMWEEIEIDVINIWSEED